MNASCLAALPDFNAIILDMDGLILDTEASYFVAWQQAALVLGFELTDHFCRSLSGMHYSMLKHKLLQYCGQNLDLERFHQYSGQFWRAHVEQFGIPVQAGFERLFEVLKEHDVSYILATNSRQVNAQECLQLAGVEHLFPAVICRDDVQKGKPAPEIFLQAAARLDCSIEQCLVIEDSLIGVQAAHYAGAFSVFIPSVLPANEQAQALASVQLNDLNELAEIIRYKFTLETDINV